MKLTEYRKKRRISQKKLAGKLGVDVTTVSKYENGQILPSLTKMRKIASVTDGDVGIDDFFQKSSGAAAS
jgi:transcriptional regulator with XRE-family HTH domain